MEFLNTILDYLMIAWEWIVDTVFLVDDYFRSFLEKIPVVGEFILGIDYLSLILLGVGALLALIIIWLIIRPKTCKCYFHVNGKKLVTKHKRKKPIVFPDMTELDNTVVFGGWYKDKKFKKLFTKEKCKKHKLHLYAKLVPADSMLLENEEIKKEAAQNQTANVESGATEEVKAYKEEIEKQFNSDGGTETVNFNSEQKTTSTIEELPFISETIMEEMTYKNLSIGEVYDKLRSVIMSYDRASSFTKIGTEAKKFIAEMFEKDNKIYLYLAIDPELMKLKGYNVEKYEDYAFSIVPTKVVLENGNNLKEVLEIIDETMVFNNMVKSDIDYAKPVVSDSVTRKNGFAFFVKNEIILSSASEFYKLLRSEIMSYKVASSPKFNKDAAGKMIVKVYKNKDLVTIYLALNAEEEGLEYVGYDKNFADTPCKYTVKSGDDILAVKTLIAKLMYLYDMEKFPAEAELSLEERTEETCGFGYRIRY